MTTPQMMMMMMMTIERPRLFSPCIQYQGISIKPVPITPIVYYITLHYAIPHILINNIHQPAGNIPRPPSHISSNSHQQARYSMNRYSNQSHNDQMFVQYQTSQYSQPRPFLPKISIFSTKDHHLVRDKYAQLFSYNSYSACYAAPGIHVRPKTPSPCQNAVKSHVIIISSVDLLQIMCLVLCGGTSLPPLARPRPSRSSFIFHLPFQLC